MNKIGNVLDLRIGLSYGPPKSVVTDSLAVDKQPNYRVTHQDRFRKANGFARHPFDPSMGVAVDERGPRTLTEAQV